jgi:4-hydroxybenzoyl-CoA thioesterase
MPGRVNRRRLRIEFGNCDPARIVYYPNYVVWVDQSTHHLFEAAGVPLRDLQARLGLQIPLVDLNFKFLAPAAWGDDIEIASEIGRWGSKSFDVEHRISNAATGQPVAEARETRVCVALDPADPKRLFSRMIPGEVKAAFTEPDA